MCTRGPYVPDAATRCDPVCCLRQLATERLPARRELRLRAERARPARANDGHPGFEGILKSRLHPTALEQPALELGLELGAGRTAPQQHHGAGGRRLQARAYLL